MGRVRLTTVLLAGLVLLAACETPEQRAERLAAAAEMLPPQCRTDQIQAVDAGTIGVVFMHGKGGMPSGHIRPLADHLSRAGFRVATPEMPWSKSRRYDRSFEDAMGEIDRAVAGLRAAGARHIAVGGQSLGGTAALGYGARRGDLDGVIVVAGGGDPYQIYQASEAIRASVGEAEALVASGKGDEQGSFQDLNAGRTTKVRATAGVYLSFYDPDGPALMPRNAADLKGGAPLLWVNGRDDPIRLTNAPDYAYDKAPANPLNAYVTVDAGHHDAPAAGRHVVDAWLRCLAG